jgi:hypothetical protein
MTEQASRKKDTEPDKKRISEYFRSSTHREALCVAELDLLADGRHQLLVGGPRLDEDGGERPGVVVVVVIGVEE